MKKRAGNPGAPILCARYPISQYRAEVATFPVWTDMQFVNRDDDLWCEATIFDGLMWVIQADEEGEEQRPSFFICYVDETVLPHHRYVTVVSRIVDDNDEVRELNRQWKDRLPEMLVLQAL